MDFDDEDDSFWDDIAPPADFLRRGQQALDEVDLADDPAQALGLRRSRHIGRQGVTGRASGLDAKRHMPEAPHVPDWGDHDNVEVEPVVDDGSFGRRRRAPRPASEPFEPAEPAHIASSDPFEWDDLPAPSPEASQAAQRLGDRDAYAQMLVPLTGEDLQQLRDQIAARTPLFEQLEQARRATDRSFQFAPPIGALLVLGWASLFGRRLVNRLIDAQADGRVERLIKQHNWYADPELAARTLAIATGTLDLMLIAALLVAGTAALIHAIARRSAEQLPVAVIDIGMATLVSMLLLARPSFTVALGLLVVTLLTQRPLRAIGRLLLAKRTGVRGGVRSSNQNAPGPRQARRGHTPPASQDEDEPDGVMLRLLARLRGDKNA